MLHLLWVGSQRWKLFLPFLFLTFDIMSKRQISAFMPCFFVSFSVFRMGVSALQVLDGQPLNHILVPRRRQEYFNSLLCRDDFSEMNFSCIYFIQHLRSLYVNMEMLILVLFLIHLLEFLSVSVGTSVRITDQVLAIACIKIESILLILKSVQFKDYFHFFNNYAKNTHITHRL